MGISRRTWYRHRIVSIVPIVPQYFSQTNDLQEHCANSANSANNIEQNQLDMFAIVPIVPIVPTKKKEEKEEKEKSFPPHPLSLKKEKKEKKEEISISSLRSDMGVRERLWADGTKILMRMTGKREPQIKSLIGRFLKSTNDDCERVMDAIERAEREQILDAIGWLCAAFPPVGKAPSPRQQMHLDRRRQIDALRNYANGTGSDMHEEVSSELDCTDPSVVSLDQSSYRRVHRSAG
jgi:hypothetical protein